MFLRKKPIVRQRGPARLPSYVRNVNSAQCLFCPYGADLKVGDRVVAWDEKTVFDREPRQRLVEITAVKAFRTNGRVVTLDFVVASDEEVARIAEDSEISPQALLIHRSGKSTYDTQNTPVVVYFRTYDPKSDVMQLLPDLDVTVTNNQPSKRYRHIGLWSRLKSWMRGWVWRNS